MDKDTDRIIEEYKERLVSLGIVPERILVFGSYANGQADEGSDLDLLVVSLQFEGMDLWERMSLLGRARSGMMRPMDILGITPAEAERPDLNSFIRREVLEKGFRVA